MLLDEPFLTVGHKLHQPGINPLQSSIYQRLPTFKNAFSFVLKIQNLFHRLPGAKVVCKHSSGLNSPGVCRLWPNYRQALLCKLSEVTLPAGIGSKICTVKDLPVKRITVTAHTLYPMHIINSVFPAYRSAVFVQRAPAHKFPNVLDFYVIRFYRFDIIVQRISKGAAVGIAG